MKITEEKSNLTEIPSAKEAMNDLLFQLRLNNK